MEDTDKMDTMPNYGGEIRMIFTEKLMRIYFDYAYNKVYDYTTARLNYYRELQKICTRKLELKDNDKVLCIGLGTGNEIYHILQGNRDVNVTGIDYSKVALQKAHKKALAMGKHITTCVMDARRLEFPSEYFDKVLCIHVMDFIRDNRQATGEILRVVKKGGQFVITYPSGREGPRLGYNLLKRGIGNIADSTKHTRIRTLLEPIVQIMAGFVYLPLLRPRKRLCTRVEVEMIIAQLVAGSFWIEEDSIYQDFIVHGQK